MAPEEIRSIVRELIALVDAEGTAGLEDERRLRFLLDRLALADHYAPTDATNGGEEDDEESWPWLERLEKATTLEEMFEAVREEDGPPRTDGRLTMEKVERRFPFLGDYRTRVFGLDGGEEPTDASARLDLADMLEDLCAIEWRWENRGAEDALWHLRMQRRVHWVSHLRGLQFVLDRREADR